MALVRDDADYAELLEAIDHAGRMRMPIAVDTETTGLHTYQDDVLRGVSVAVADREWYLSITHPDSPQMAVQPLLDALNAFPEQVYMHHAVFDIGVLSKAGNYQYPIKLWDTQVGDWLIDENARSHALKDVAAREFGFDAHEEQRHLAALRRGTPQATFYKQLRNGDNSQFVGVGTTKLAREEAKRLSAASKRDWPTFTAEDLAKYASLDARLTYDLGTLQAERIADGYDRGEPYDVGHDVPREMRYQRTLYNMIRTGIRVDTDAAIHATHVAEQRLAEIHETLGGINLNSPDQLRDLMFGEWRLSTNNRTGTGQLSTDKATLEELEGQHPGITLILEHRQKQKMLSAYLRPLVERQDADGRVHSAFNSARTVTGRLASSDPNLQTIPKESTNALVRSLFIPSDGMELWEFDLSQAELRVAAGYSGDVRLNSALDEGRDLHSEVAASIWWENDIDAFMAALEAGDITAAKQRGLGKNINYSYQYGVGPRKLAMYLVAGTDRVIDEEVVAEARQILDGYAETFVGLSSFMKRITGLVDARGYIPLHVPGRYRRYRGPGYYDRKTYTSFNAIVQGGVGEFLKDIQMAAEPMVDNYGRICLQVHDSMVMELDPGSGPVVASRLQEISDQINPFKITGTTRRVPMIWDAKTWGK